MTIEPDPCTGLAGGKGVDAVRAWPVAEPCHQALLAAVREQVAEPTDLRLLFGAYGNRLVAALEQGPAPAMEAAGLFGEIRVDVAAEARELARILGRKERVPVIGEADEGVNVDVVERCGASKNADEDLA